MSGLSCGPTAEVGQVVLGVIQRLVLERGQISEAVARTGGQDTLAQVGRGEVRRVVGGDLQAVTTTTGGEGEGGEDEDEKLTLHCGYLLPLG